MAIAGDGPAGGNEAFLDELSDMGLAPSATAPARVSPRPDAVVETLDLDELRPLLEAAEDASLPVPADAPGAATALARRTRGRVQRQATTSAERLRARCAVWGWAAWRGVAEPALASDVRRDTDILAAVRRAAPNCRRILVLEGDAMGSGGASTALVTAWLATTISALRRDPVLAGDLSANTGAAAMLATRGRVLDAATVLSGVLEADKGQRRRLHVLGAGGVGGSGADALSALHRLEARCAVSVVYPGPAPDYEVLDELAEGAHCVVVVATDGTRAGTSIAGLLSERGHTALSVRVIPVTVGGGSRRHGGFVLSPPAGRGLRIPMPTQLRRRDRRTLVAVAAAALAAGELRS